MKPATLRSMSPALVLSVIALVVALGGTSYAVSQLPANSVGTAQLKNRAVTNNKLSPSTIAFIKAQHTPAATYLFGESAGGTSPTLEYARGVTSVAWEGIYYLVTLNRNVSNCVPLGTVTGINGDDTAGYISVVHRAGDANELNVQTFQSSNDESVSTIPFAVAVLC